LGMELTLWKEKRSNILVARNLSIPKIYGFSSLPMENIGKLKSHGFELTMSHRKTMDRFSYSVEANIAFARNEILFMDETPMVELYQNQTGHPIGAGLYYQSDGIFNTQEELDSFPHANASKLGDIKIIDVNGDSVINADDRVRSDYNANATPEYVFGLNISLQYHDFDLSIFFQGQTKAANYDVEFIKLGNTDFDNAAVARAENRWSVDNPNGTMPRADSWQPGATDFFFYDATFIRLKTIELGYSLPEKLTTKLRVKDFRIYANAFNLLTWAKEIKWCDPELVGNFTYYPQQRVINLGINLKF
jgi:hypothetical protein